MTTRMVIVGASLAGLRAAEGARRAGFDGDITLMGAESHVPYDRPPLSKKYLTGEVEADFYRVEEKLRADVDLQLDTTATSLSPVERLIVTSAGDRVRYDSLIIATGAVPRKLPDLPESSRILTLRTLDDAERLRRHITQGSHVVVVGGGFVGAEIASSARQLGAEVTIVEIAAVPLVRAVGEVVGQALSGLHAKNGARLIVETPVASIAESAAGVEVVLSDGEHLSAAVVVVGTGAVPATTWLAGSGVELHPLDGGVVCDSFLRSSLPDVYAAGDVAHWPSSIFDTSMRLENWTNAAEQGARAGANAADPSHAVPYDTVPYFWSDWYGHRIQFVGVPDAEYVEFVSGGPEEERFVAVYVVGDRVVGAATLNQPRKTMKLRRLILERGGLDAAVELATTGAAAPVAVGSS